MSISGKYVPWVFDFDGTICEARFSDKCGDLMWLDGDLIEEDLVCEHMVRNVYADLHPVGTVVAQIEKGIQSGRNVYVLSRVHSSLEADMKKCWLAKHIVGFSESHFIGVFTLSQKVAVLNLLAKQHRRLCPTSCEKEFCFIHAPFSYGVAYVDDALPELLEMRPLLHDVGLFHVSSLLTE